MASPRREIVVLEPTLDCRCADPSCRTKIREDVTEVLERLPSQMKVIRYVRPIYACRACQSVVQTPAPDLPILIMAEPCSAWTATPGRA